jgi:hypothetical protein
MNAPNHNLFGCVRGLEASSLARSLNQGSVIPSKRRRVAVVLSALTHP